jgi:hypothetical protein
MVEEAPVGFLWGFFCDLQYVYLALFAAEIGLIATVRR